MLKITLILLLVIPPLIAFYFFSNGESPKVDLQPVESIINPPTPTPSPKFNLPDPPQTKMIPNSYHVFQTFNNCGPAALSMALSYYSINISQKVLGDELRPYQNPQGDNDDKSVTLKELGEKAKELNLTPYHRPAGDFKIVKYFIANDIPVITRTLLNEKDDIGHYRVIKGYDDNKQQFIQDDSLQGKNLTYSYSDFNNLWKHFNYEYLVLIPNEKLVITEEILGADYEREVAWKKAVKFSTEQLEKNPNDITARFNLSVALFNIGDFEGSVREFEKVEKQLPLRTLWYQIEPIQAYYKLQNYNRVFEITNNILNNHNRAFSELYLLRGEIYLSQQNTTSASQEFEKAVFYNQTFKSKIPKI